VGMSLAKGFSAALGVPLAGASSLDAVAHQIRTASGTLLALVDAGRELVYAGTYRSTARGLRREGELATFTDDELAAHAGSLGSVLVCGELTPVRAERLRAVPGVRLASPAAGLRRPACLAELGYLRWLAEGPADPAALQPLYLKRG
jgi:tRNA A37 threonylcarbamoyladenosine modification protein TsaB